MSKSSRNHEGFLGSAFNQHDRATAIFSIPVFPITSHFLKTSRRCDAAFIRLKYSMIADSCRQSSNI